MIMIHGRGASAEDILGLADAFDQPNCAYLAPQAAGHSWYPNRFTAPLASNEPHLTSALLAIENLLARIGAAHVPAERTILFGFSQGGCLAVEFAARNARRYGGVAVFSGGLIGPDDIVFDYPGSLDGTPVFLGSDASDPHIPLKRVHESTVELQRMGAEVTERIYSGMGHTVNEDEISFVQSMMKALT
jgi:predicted esterase